MVPNSVEVRVRVRQTLERLVEAIDDLPSDAAGRGASAESISGLGRYLGAELPAALDEFFLRAGGRHSDICEWLQPGETRSTVQYLSERGVSLRRATIEMGADPDRASRAIPLTSTAEAVTLVDSGGPDPVVWYVLEDGESGDLASSFTDWLAASVDLAIANWRAGFRLSPPPGSSWVS